MIKKVLFCIFFILFADLCYADNVNFENSKIDLNRVCVKNTVFLSPYKYMKEKSLETFLKNYIKQKTGIDVEVSLSLDSESSENKYVFNNAKVYSNKLKYGCIQLTDAVLASVNDKDTVIRNGNKILLPQDIPVNFSAKITNEDLEYLTASPAYINFVSGLTDQYSMYINVKETKLFIDNNNIRFQLIGKLPILFGMPVKITVTPILEVSDGHIYIREISADKNSSTYINRILPFLNFSQPIDSYLKISESIGISYQFDSLTIENNELLVGGLFIIPQNCDINK